MSARTKAIAAIALVLIAVGIPVIFISQSENGPFFDGQTALADAAYQMGLGPRVVGSVAHNRVITWIVQTLRNNGWQVNIQETERLGHPVKNIIAKRGSGQPWIVLGAHYDSRMLADQDADPEMRQEPVPGANDGASGVAVLLELGRALPRNLAKQIWLVFFDAEDNGRIEGWDWILGSRAFAESLTTDPDAVVVVDMVGDADLQIYLEANSDQSLRQAIWQQAEDLGYGQQFIDTVVHSMLDDHTPFLERGIPAVDIIDFDYPYWHTSADTLDKISAESLQAVGDTLLNWVITH